LQSVFANFQEDDDTYGTGEEQKVFTKSDGVDGNNALQDATALFSGLVFFLNREVSQEWLQFCIVSYGGKVGWEGEQSPYSVDDARVTHHVIDRPIQGLQLAKTREYVQPQWIFDCINAKLRLSVELYKPGRKLPPHLSPFVDDEKEGYLPRYGEEIKKLQQQQNGGEAAKASGITTVAVNSSGHMAKNSAKQPAKVGRGGDDNSDEEEAESAFHSYRQELKAERNRAKKAAAAAAATTTSDMTATAQQPRTRGMTASSWAQQEETVSDNDDDHREEDASSSSDDEEEKQQQGMKELHGTYTKQVYANNKSSGSQQIKGLKAVPFQPSNQKQEPANEVGDTANECILCNIPVD
jgi:pescadillo protein